MVRLERQALPGPLPPELTSSGPRVGTVGLAGCSRPGTPSASSLSVAHAHQACSLMAVGWYHVHAAVLQEGQRRERLFCT